MSLVGQTEKNSVRANVFRVAPDSGHCSMQSACFFGAQFRPQGSLFRTAVERCSVSGEPPAGRAEVLRISGGVCAHGGLCSLFISTYPLSSNRTGFAQFIANQRRTSPCTSA